MAVGRVAKKLYAQQGEYGSLRKAYKEAFRRQMIANYAPSNVVGRMFGFGSIFHTMAKRAFGTPEWDPKSLETGRSAGPGMSAGAWKSSMPSRLSDAILSDIAENTDRTATALEKIEAIEKRLEKKSDISENFRREREFEAKGYPILPVGETGTPNLSKIGGSKDLLSSLLPLLPMLGLGIGGGLLGGGGLGVLGGLIGGGLLTKGGRGLLKGGAKLLSRFGPVGMVLGGLGSAVMEYMESGDVKMAVAEGLSALTFGIFSKEWFSENIVTPISTVFKTLTDSIVQMGSDVWTWMQRQGQGLWDWLGPHNPFAPTGEKGIENQGQINERRNSRAKHRQVRTPYSSPMSPVSSSYMSTKGGSYASPLTSVKTAPGSGVPAEAESLLSAIAMKESGGSYTRIVGDGKFGGPAQISDFSKHPGVAGVGLTAKTGGKWVGVNDPRAVITSSAAGKYQITKSTWDRLRKKYPDLTDFSPKNQDKAAWYLAQEDYKRNTGKDLLTSLRNGAFKASALSSTWTSLPGGSEQTWKGEKQFQTAMLTGGATAQPMSSPPKLNVPAATASVGATKMAAASAAGTTQIQASMSAPEAMGAVVMNNMPTASLGIPPQMGESVDEFVTRVLVAMGVVTQT